MDLNSEILNRTQEVQQFALNAAAAKRNDEQKKIDQNFSDVIKMVSALVEHIIGATKKTSFRCSDELNESLKELLQNSKVLTNSGAVRGDQVFGIKKKVIEINEEVSSQWSEYYADETKSVEELLSLARNIAGSDVSSLLMDIRSAKDWKTNDACLDKMTMGLKNAKSLITKLDLQDNIVQFLKKMINQEATLADLDEEVMEWITREGIKSKIKIGFTR